MRQSTYTNPQDEILEREALAERRLSAMGELEHAREWLQKNPPPAYWTGTPLEYAETEMPCL